MTSTERHEMRYQRRKQKRLQHKQQQIKDFDNYDKVFTFEHLYDSYKKCCRGVGWKESTQRYKINAIVNINNTLTQLKAYNFKSRGFKEFIICERGKLRHIRAVHISERIVQRCLCDYSLTPILSRSFIYDNGACIKGKGVDFAVRRLKVHLHRHYQKYRTNGYALVFDFSKYFDNIKHNILKEIINNSLTDKHIIDLVNQLIDDFGAEGLGLGSQISQISALRYPSELDHYIKEILHIKNYARYMDDGYLLYGDKEYLQKCLSNIKQICDKYGIKLNQKKTQIVKISHGITFLQRKFILTKSGKVIVKPVRKHITKMRHKLKKFKKWYDEGKMALEDIKTSFISFKGHLKHCNAYYTTRRFDLLFQKLFCQKETIK
jgi:hypothetical protein